MIRGDLSLIGASTERALLKKFPTYMALFVLALVISLQLNLCALHLS